MGVCIYVCVCMHAYNINGVHIHTAHVYTYCTYNTYIHCEHVFMLNSDLSLVIINSLAGVTKMTKEHLGVVLALEIPLACVVTKIDMVYTTHYTQLHLFLYIHVTSAISYVSAYVYICI